MEETLDFYIERISPLFSHIEERTGHEIAAALISYKFGIYENVLKRCDRAIRLLGDSDAEATVRKALGIVREDATYLRENVSIRSYGYAFTDEERVYLALDIPEDQVEYMPGFQLHNALLLIYAVALIASPDDREALEEQRKFALMIIEPYLKLLGK
jgi:hypothetical protein